jgi:hypothetical protein
MARLLFGLSCVLGVLEMAHRLFNDGNLLVFGVGDSLDRSALQIALVVPRELLLTGPAESLGVHHAKC